MCTNKIISRRGRRPRRPEPNVIIALHIIKKIALYVLDLVRINNLMPTDLPIHASVVGPYSDNFIITLEYCLKNNFVLSRDVEGAVPYG